MDVLIQFFFWAGWAVLVGLPLSLGAWAIYDNIRHHNRDALTRIGCSDRDA